MRDGRSDSDIVERLSERLGDGKSGARIDHIAPDLSDAINEITRLRAERDALADVVRLFEGSVTEQDYGGEVARVMSFAKDWPLEITPDHADIIRRVLEDDQR